MYRTMSDNNLELQISEMNRKLDLMLEEAAIQRQSREVVTDLVDDLTIVGNDAFKGMVEGLDNAGIELDFESLNHLFLGFIRNIENINMLLMSLENITDLMKDAGPIVKQMGIDAVDKFNEIDAKGYFEVIRQIMGAMDSVMSKYSKEDLASFGENVEITINTMLSITDPAVMNKVKIFVDTYKEIDHESIPEYSIWKVMRELNKPDMKKSIGFIMTFLKKINAKDQNLPGAG